MPKAKPTAMHTAKHNAERHRQQVKLWQFLYLVGTVGVGCRAALVERSILGCQATLAAVASAVGADRRVAHVHRHQSQRATDDEGTS